MKEEAEDLGTDVKLAIVTATESMWTTLLT